MEKEFTLDELKLAHKQGGAAGEIALAEFVLASYGDKLDPKLKIFLEKVKQEGYEVVGEIFETPAEDVALEVLNILERTVKTTK